MKILLPTLFVVLALSACDRRATQPPEQSTTTDTATATPAPATAAPANAPPDTATSLPPPITAESCDDLSGQAQTDCLERNRVRAAPPATSPQDTDGQPTPPAG